MINLATTRAIYRAVAIPGCPPPYDRASLKVYYPARRDDNPTERNTGLVAANPALAPFPVVILLPGINLGPEAYGWLAELLATQGVVTVTYTLITEEMPGYISQGPGLDLAALAPENYGGKPSATAITPILDELRHLNQGGVLGGKLDLDHVVLGGHSAGGSVAMLNARPDWFPGVCAAFSYGAHAGAATSLGHPPDSLLALPAAVPIMIIGGTRDGCIANSAARYGDPGAKPENAATMRVERSFDEAISRNQGDCYLAIIDGANHFSLAWPADRTTGRSFIDMDATRPDTAIRALLGQLIGHFVAAGARADEVQKAQLETLLRDGHPLLSRGAIR